jgi:hypothetical protein
MISKLGIYFVGLLVICAGSWFGYYKIEQKGYDRAQAELQQANLELAIAYANRLTKAEGERDANQVIIDRLASQRVQVHFPVCPSTGQNPDGTAGILSQRVDQIFADFQERGRVLFERCEALNADAIKLNAVLIERK